MCSQKNLSLKDLATLVASSAQPKWLHVSPFKVPSALSCLCSLACLLQITDLVARSEKENNSQVLNSERCVLKLVTGCWDFLATSSLKSSAGLFPSSSSYPTRDRVPYFNLAPVFCGILQIWVLFYYLT